MASTQGSSEVHDEEKVAVSYDEQPVTLQTEADHLPPGYFKSASFIGTMFAAQSAWAAVRFPFPFSLSPVLVIDEGGETKTDT